MEPVLDKLHLRGGNKAPFTLSQVPTVADLRIRPSAPDRGVRVDNVKLLANA
jgi:hypothetical protein